MLRVLVLSDLHLEFGDLRISGSDHDVVVLAGDVHVGTQGVKWAMAQFPSCPVIYVPGNHEYYGNVIPKLTVELKRLCQNTNVVVLDNDTAEIGGVVFLGTTLWTDFNLFGDVAAAEPDAAQRISDYRRIRVAPRYSKLRPIDTRVFHRRAVTWLNQALQEHKDEPVVIATHHAPSARSVEARYASDALTPAFASNLDEVVAASAARLWIHGHLHNSSDYGIQGTRVVCNPRGYADELNPAFRADLIVNIP